MSAQQDPLVQQINELVSKWAKERYGWSTSQLYLVKNAETRKKLRAEAIEWVEEDMAQALAFEMQENLGRLERLK